jgi:predicted ester cyclase
MITQTEHIKLIALRFAQEGWGTHPNWQKTWDELMSHDVVHHFNSSPEPIVGLEANKAFNAKLFQGFPDIRHTIENAIAEGDTVVYRTTIQGKCAKINDFTLLRIVDGKIAEWWYECNLLALMQQLGLIPA